MTWEKGRYFTQSQRIAGQVQRTYYGNSALAQQVAREFEQRQTERRRIREEVARINDLWAEIDRLMNVFDRFVKAVTTAAFTEVGFHKHRGQWRKRRMRRDEEGSS